MGKEVEEEAGGVRGGLEAHYAKGSLNPEP
jgi:hypothetical protein